MIKNYLKTAWRNLVKNKFYSFINIAGLTAGLAIGILILLWVQDELSFDRFHKRTRDIFRLELFGGTGSSRQIWTVDVAPIGPLAKQQLPEVKDQVRLTENYNYSLYKYRDKVFSDENAVFADPSLFSIFDFPIVKGNAARPFTDDNSVVITRKTAEKFFGSQDPIGKVITADTKVNFTVSGVIDDFPTNSSMQYDMIMPMSFHIKDMLVSNRVDLENDFSNFSYETYLLLKPGTSLKDLSAKIFQIHISHRPEDTDADYLLQPLSKMHLYNADGTNKGIETVRIFTIIALLILIIACINYVNISVARSLLRAKEISMRKIVGAGKMQLFFQFIIETALLFALAAIFAIGLLSVLMPLFNQLAGKQLVFSLVDSHIWLVMLLAISGTLAASSIYPALILSSFEPLKAMKGKISAHLGNTSFRRILVVVQFVFSVVLIIGTIVVTGQLNYIRSKDLGYDKTHVFSSWMREMGKHYDAVKAELLKQPGITAVTRSNQNIVRFGGFSGDTEWDGKAPGQTLIIHPMAIDKDFMLFFKMKLMEGTGFTGSVNDTAHYILNETAVKELAMIHPIGKRFRMGKINGTIIGVAKDFHYASMKEKIAPALFYYKPDYLNTIYVKTTGQDAPKAIHAVETQFKQYNGEFPFGHSFLDDRFNNLYQGEEREGVLFNYFAAIAIFISCLGLLGLAAYTAQVRTREIGVRKVLGASITSVLLLLSKDFIRLVLIAIVIAVPLAWYSMNKWLQAFAYRISIGWWMFALAGAMAIVIALFTISFQAVKAAVANPAKSLKTE
jgi:putative ABC transport system permease protein